MQPSRRSVDGNGTKNEEAFLALRGRRCARGTEPRVQIPTLLGAALAARAPLLDEGHTQAARVFAGFAEGDPSVALDVYGRTLVIHDRSEADDGDRARADALADAVFAQLPWLRACVWKARRGATPEARNGRVIRGERAHLDRRVREHGVWYALDLTMNRDAGFYLDTRGLRAWAMEHLRGARVLNTFAYTGSLGVAARGGGARAVVQLDRNGTFLDLARRSDALNGWPTAKGSVRARDVFAEAARLRREGALFDCVFVDPPFFSKTAAGTVDLEEGAGRVLDKLRPLVGDGGALVAVNNALWCSGAAWMGVLDAACGGYASVESMIAVPDDTRGMVGDGALAYPTDPSPFAHPTKIAVLRVRRKDGRRAT